MAGGGGPGGPGGLPSATTSANPEDESASEEYPRLTERTERVHEWMSQATIDISTRRAAQIIAMTAFCLIIVAQRFSML